MNKSIIKVNDAPEPVGPYNHLVKTGDLYFSSGQIPLEPHSGKLISEDIESQAHQVFKNVGALLKSAGLDYKNLIKCTLFLTDLGDFAKINAIYGEYITSEFPARSTIEVSKLPLGAKFEMEFVATNS